MLPRDQRAVRRARPGMEGFKILEVLIAVGVLTIASLSLVRLHGSVISGVERSSGLSQALDIATSRMDSVAPTGGGQLPACDFDGAEGCRTGAAQFAAAKANAGAYRCTAWTGGADIVPGGTQFFDEGAAQGASPGRRPYRVDTSVRDLGDPNRGQNTTVLTISVCWEDDLNRVHQVQLERAFVQDL